MSIPIHERFLSWQGEGVHMGRSAFFIRTFGCAQKCPWCDSAGTWHSEYVPKSVERYTVEQLANEAEASQAAFVVITGGEPAHHNLTPLCDVLHQRGLKVHLETSGAYDIRGRFDWITLSPKNKWARPALSFNVQQAREFKLVIEEPGDIAYWQSVLQIALGMEILAPTWLHPEWSKREDLTLLHGMTSWVKEHGDPWRIGYQLHKLYRADYLDKRTAPLAPLGGNPSLGY